MGKLAILTLLILLLPAPALAQTATPPPSPTPTVIDFDEGIFVVEPVITFGEAGIMIGLVMVAGLLLVSLGLDLSGVLGQWKH